nr:MAG TPA: Nuclear polyadenylated RNA-binding 2 protein CCCH zinc finger 1 [Caudoviricetes sp.]DAV47936.1 MAG TPA: Nuclear polyadenylated RNA-binding 2 protein CCCH zinc finger 1 [Caudoviricetes sp.]
MRQVAAGHEGKFPYCPCPRRHHAASPILTGEA